MQLVQRSGILNQNCFIVLTTVIVLVHFLPEECYSQPFFKGGIHEFFTRNSKNKITPFPSKALPRIGRRNGPDGMDDARNERSEKSFQNINSVVPFSYRSDNYGQGNTFEPTAPTALPPPALQPGSDSGRTRFSSLIKYLLKRGFIRSEDAGYFTGFMSKVK